MAPYNILSCACFFVTYSFAFFNLIIEFKKKIHEITPYLLYISAFETNFRFKENRKVDCIIFLSPQLQKSLISSLWDWRLICGKEFLFFLFILSIIRFFWVGVGLSFMLHLLFLLCLVSDIYINLLFFLFFVFIQASFFLFLHNY